MSKYLWLLALLLVHVTGAPAQNQAIVNRSNTVQIIDGEQFYFHAVIQGQTLFSIAKAYGVSQEEIILANPELNTGLRYDQMILIPAGKQPAVAQQDHEQKPSDNEKFIEHTVRRSETLYGISRQYGVSMEDIIKYNPDAGRGLKPRQILRIAVIQPQVSGTFHVVAPGETLFSISRRFGVSVDDITAANPGLTTDIHPGQSIEIPRSGAETFESKEQMPPPQRLVFVLPDEEGPQPAENDTLCFDLTLKDKYNVALFIPLYLEEVDSITDSGELDLFHKSFAFVEYYNGVLIALDSIRSVSDVDITLHVFDVDQSLGKAREAINSPEFSEMDLIIGPFFSQPLSFVAGYGLRNNIPVVSPLLNDTRVLKGFPNLFQVHSSLQSQLADMANYISNTYTDQNIILVHNSQRQAAELIDGFKDSFKKGIRTARYHQDSLNLARVNGYFINESMVGHRRTNVLVMNDSIFEVRSAEVEPSEYFRENPLKEVIFTREGIDGVKEVLEHNKKNIIITLIEGEAFLSNYLRELHHDTMDYDMILFGTPQWQEYQNIETDYLQNLNVHLFTSDFQDYRDAHTRSFVLRYREVFKTEPRTYAFKGVETGWFFFNALVNYGPDFSNCISVINNMQSDHPFIFRQTQGSNAGWENEKTTLFRYENYRKVDVRKPIIQETTSR